MVEECRRYGWKAHCEPIEVGCRALSLLQAFNLHGIRGLQERRATNNKTEAAENALRWLWIKKGEPWSSTPLGHKPGTDHPQLGRPREGV